MTAVPEWDSVGDLAQLRDRDAARNLLVEAGLDIERVRPDYLRLKPGEGALVGFEFTVAESDGRTTPVPGYARTFADPARAATVYSKARTKRIVDGPLGSGVTLLSSGRTVVFTFPNDAGLPGLHRVVRLSKLLRTLDEMPRFSGSSIGERSSTLLPVRYKPERRFVARLQARPVDSADVEDGSSEHNHTDFHVRWFGDGRGAIGDAVGRELAASGVNVATPLGTASDGRLSAEATVPGVTGVAARLGGSLDPGAVGHHLAALHGVTTTMPKAARRAGSEFALVSALAALDTIAAVEPRLAGAACRLAVALGCWQPDSNAVAGIHGDLHLGQIIVAPGRISFIDLERFAVGAPLIDVASFVAHLLEMETTHPQLGPTDDDQASFRRNWTERSGHSDAGFGAMLACALVERVLLGFRTFEPDWAARAEVLFDQAIDALGSGRWTVIHPRPNGFWTATESDGPAHGVVLDEGRIAKRSPLTDPDLPGLASVAGLGLVRSYRPGRRTVLESEDARSFIKVLRPERAGGTIERWSSVARLLADDPSAPHVPDVRDDSRPGDGIIVLGALAGRPLHDVLIDEHDPAIRSAAVREATDLVARFHQVDAGVLHLPEGGQGGAPCEWTGVLSRVHPNLAKVYTRVAEMLVDPVPSGARSLVHGDLHDRNVLLDGGSGAIIDLDGVGLGDPAIDVGNLAAHVVLRALQRGDTVDVGRAEARLVVEGHALGEFATPWAARTLFRLAVLYRFRVRWAHLTPALLNESTRWVSADDM